MNFSDYLDVLRFMATDFGRGHVVGLAANKLEPWQQRYLLNIALELNLGRKV